MFNKKFDVITIGSSTRDVLLRSQGFEIRKHDDSPTGIEQCFSLGSKIEIKDITFATGGGGTNAAVTFGRQGFDTACVGVVGDDITGQEIIWELKKDGVDTGFFQKHKDGLTAYSIILVHPDGERTILSYKGEGQYFDVRKVPFDKMRAQWFYLDSIGGHYDLLWSAVHHAANNDIKIAFNPGGKELNHGLEKLIPILKYIDIFITNKEEGAQLVGLNPKKEDEVMFELKKLIQHVVILSDGPNGVVVRDGDRGYRAGVPDSPVVERTGAGDAFGSGFVAEYIRSHDIEKAIQFGTANASSVVTQFGAKAGILKKGDWGPWPLVEVIKN